MIQASFVMCTQKQGRIKYLLLTVAPTVLISYLTQHLIQLGILPAGGIWGLLYTVFSMSLMLILGYFLIFVKNHQIAVSNQQIVETNWLGKQKSPIDVHSIHHVRKNFLNEIILFDKNRKRLLCVESNMSNFNTFTQWLEAHHK